MKQILMAVLAAAVLVGFTAGTCQAGKACCAPKDDKADAKCEVDKTKCSLTKCHVLKIDGAKATMCQCKKACKCEISADDATKCSCGKPVCTMDLKGKFTCAHCAVISNKAGKCKCGADLTEVKE